jgi:hypothetical protein
MELIECNYIVDRCPTPKLAEHHTYERQLVIVTLILTYKLT